MVSTDEYICVKSKVNVSNSNLWSELFNLKNTLSRVSSHSIVENNNIILSSDAIAMYNKLETSKPNDHHEVITTKDNGYVRVYFDIDDKNIYDQNIISQSYTSYAKLIQTTIRRLVLIDKYIMNKSQKDESKIELYTNYTIVRDEDPNRFSMHLIFPNLIVTQDKVLSLVNDIIKELGNSDLKNKIDTQIYRDNSSMRTIWSAKSDGSHRLIPHEDQKSISFNPAHYFVNGFIHQNCDTITSMNKHIGTGSLYDQLVDLFSPNPIMNDDDVKSALNNNSKSFAIKVDYLNQCSICSASSHDNQHRVLRKANMLRISKFADGCKNVDIAFNKLEDNGSDDEYSCAVFINGMGIIAKNSTDISKLYLWDVIMLRWEDMSINSLPGYILNLLKDDYCKSVLKDYTSSITNVKKRKLIAQNVFDMSYADNFIIGTDPPNMIRMKNGVLDIKNQTLLSQDVCKMYLFTRTTNADFIKRTDFTTEDNIRFREVKKCIDQILPPMINNKINPDRIIAEQIFSTVLSSFSRGYIVHLHGDSNSGKTTFLNLLTSFLRLSQDGYSFIGNHSIIGGITRSDGDDNPSPSLAALKNRKLVKITEPKKSFVWQDEKIKRLTESGIACRELFANLTVVDIDCLITVDSNFYAIIDTVGEYTTKRLRTINFRSKFVSHSNNVDEANHYYMKDNELSQRINTHDYNNVIIHVLFEWYNKHHLNKKTTNSEIIQHQSFEFYQIFRDFKSILILAIDESQLNVTYLETMITRIMNNNVDPNILEKLSYLKKCDRDEYTCKRLKRLIPQFVNMYGILDNRNDINIEYVKAIDI